MQYVKFFLIPPLQKWINNVILKRGVTTLICRCDTEASFLFLDLALEIFKKCCCGQKLLPLNNQRDFVLLYDGESTAMKKQMQKTSGSVARFNPNNTCKTYKSTLIATPAWKSTNMGAKCPINGITTEPPAKRLATSTVSVWSNTSPLSQQPIELPYRPLGGAAVTKKTRIPRIQETNQLRPHQPKPARARVELHLSKCTWHEPVTSNLNVPPHVLPVRSAIRSLSTPSLSKASHSTQGVGAQSMPIDNRDHISCNLKTSKINFAHVDKREPKEKDGWWKLTTQCLKIFILKVFSEDSLSDLQ